MFNIVNMHIKVFATFMRAFYLPAYQTWHI
jgi:hypothetical protein